VRRVRALTGKPAKATIDRARLPSAFEPLMPAVQDFKAAMHIKELEFADVAAAELTFVEEPVA
jgi:hypothetical protein